MYQIKVKINHGYKTYNHKKPECANARWQKCIAKGLDCIALDQDGHISMIAENGVVMKATKLVTYSEVKSQIAAIVYK